MVQLTNFKQNNRFINPYKNSGAIIPTKLNLKAGKPEGRQAGRQAGVNLKLAEDQNIQPFASFS